MKKRFNFSRGRRREQGGSRPRSKEKEEGNLHTQDASIRSYFPDPRSVLLAMQYVVGNPIRLCCWLISFLRGSI